MIAHRIDTVCFCGNMKLKLDDNSHIYKMFFYTWWNEINAQAVHSVIPCEENICIKKMHNI
jgi:hypothetical protein